jgi:hypothetical protein
MTTSYPLRALANTWVGTSRIFNEIPLYRLCVPIEFGLREIPVTVCPRFSSYKVIITLYRACPPRSFEGIILKVGKKTGNPRGGFPGDFPGKGFRGYLDDDMRSRKSSGSNDCDVKLLGHFGSFEEDRRVVSSVDRCGVLRGRGFEEMRGAAAVGGPALICGGWAAKRGDSPDDQIIHPLPSSDGNLISVQVKLFQVSHTKDR